MNMKSTGFPTLELDSPRPMNSWGIRWNPSVKRLNSRPSSSRCKRNESKRSQNDESNHTREGGKGRTRRTQTRFTRTTHKSNPRGHEEVRASIPAAIFGSYINYPICGPLSQENLREGENLEKDQANERGKGDGSSLILFNRAITQFQFCP